MRATAHIAGVQMLQAFFKPFTLSGVIWVAVEYFCDC